MKVDLTAFAAILWIVKVVPSFAGLWLDADRVSSRWLEEYRGSAVIRDSWVCCLLRTDHRCLSVAGLRRWWGGCRNLPFRWGWRSDSMSGRTLIDTSKPWSCYYDRWSSYRFWCRTSYRCKAAVGPSIPGWWSTLSSSPWRICWPAFGCLIIYWCTLCRCLGCWINQVWGSSNLVFSVVSSSWSKPTFCCILGQAIRDWWWRSGARLRRHLNWWVYSIIWGSRTLLFCCRASHCQAYGCGSCRCRGFPSVWDIEARSLVFPRRILSICFWLFPASLRTLWILRDRALSAKDLPCSSTLIPWIKVVFKWVWEYFLLLW